MDASKINVVPGLMLRIQRRDQAAMAELYILCHARVLRQIIYLTKDEPLARDIAQDVFLRIWRYASAYSPEKTSNALAWINQIARNQVLTHYAQRKRRQECSDDELSEHAAESDVSGQEARMTTNSPAFKAALEALKPSVKRVIILRFFNDKSLAEISSEMNVSLGTVKTWLHRGLARMKGLLEGISLESVSQRY